MSSVDQDLLEIARLVNIRVNQEVLSTNQIIDRQKYTNIPGIAEGPRFDFAREYRGSLVKTREHFCSNGLSSAELYIAVAKSGIGECAEMSTLTCSYLDEHGVKNIYVLSLTGGISNQSGGMKRHDHACILASNNNDDLSAISSGLKDISKLCSLPDSVVIIDPFIKHAGVANKYTKDASSYLNLYGFKNISVMMQPKEGIIACKKSVQEKLQGSEEQKYKADLDLMKTNKPVEPPGPWFGEFIFVKDTANNEM